jgi:hypothetical protein
MVHPLVWCVGLLGLLVPVMGQATASPPRPDLGPCPAWTAGVECCACPCACMSVPGEPSGPGPWWQGLGGPHLLACWLALEH